MFFVVRRDLLVQTSKTATLRHWKLAYFLRSAKEYVWCYESHRKIDFVFTDVCLPVDVNDMESTSPSFSKTCESPCSTPESTESLYNLKLDLPDVVLSGGRPWSRRCMHVLKKLKHSDVSEPDSVEFRIAERLAEIGDEFEKKYFSKVGAIGRPLWSVSFLSETLPRVNLGAVDSGDFFPHVMQPFDWSVPCCSSP